MKLIRRVGSTSHVLQIFIRDSSSTTGAGLTGLTSASAGLTAYYHRNTDTTATSVSLVTMTVGTYTSGGFKEIDATNIPGWYQFCPPDAAFASGANSVGFHLKGATNMAPLPIEVDLDAQVDVYSWNGTAVATPATAGVPDVNVKNINNVAASSVTTVNANIGTAQPTNFTGTGGSALVKSDTVDIAGAAVSTSSAQIGVNVVNAGGTAWGSGAITRSAFSADSGLQSVRSNTLASAAGASATLDAGASAVDNFYVGDLLYITGGTGAGQSRVVTGYVGASKVASVRTWTTAPDNTSTYSLVRGEFPRVDSNLYVTANLATIASVNVAQWNGASVAVPNLAGVPVVDVGYFLGTASAGTAGYAGIDWGHVNAPTTVVNLSGTTISTSQAVASVAGAVGSVTAPVTANVIRTGTAQAGGANTITLDAGASATNNTYQNEIVYVVSGTGAGQVNTVASYVGATKVATMIANWATNPDNTSVFQILPQGPISATVSGSVTVGGYSAGQDPATLVLDAVAASHNTAGTIGAKINTAGGYSFPANFSSLGITVAGKISEVVLTDTTTAVTNGVTVSTNNDKTGYSLSASQTFNMTGNITGNLSGSVGSVTGNVGGNVVGSVGLISGVTFPTNFGALSITLAGKIAEVALTDTLTTYTGNTPQTGDSFARIGANGAGLTSLAPSATALSTAQWTNALATALGTLSSHDPGSTLASASAVSGIPAAILAATITELSTIPAASPTLTQAIALLYMTLRNEITVDATTKNIHNDAGALVGTKALSDNGTTYTEGKLA